MFPCGKDAASNESTVSTEIATFSSNALLMMAPSTEHLFNAGEQAFYSVKMPAVGAATDSERREVNKPFAISCIADPNSASVSAAETWLRTEQFGSVYMFYAPINEKRTEGAEVAFIAAEKTGIREIISLDKDFDIYRLPGKEMIHNIYK